VPDESREPAVIVDFEWERGLLFLVVRNIGTRVALRVSCRFDQRFHGLGGTREMTALALLRNIEFLAPGREIRTLLDTSAAYFDRNEPTRLTARITYSTADGARHESTIAHDLSIYRDLAYVTEGASHA
jgi:hypothetical protein